MAKVPLALPSTVARSRSPPNGAPAPTPAAGAPAVAGGGRGAGIVPGPASTRGDARSAGAIPRHPSLRSRRRVPDVRRRRAAHRDRIDRARVREVRGYPADAEADGTAEEEEGLEKGEQGRVERLCCKLGEGAMRNQGASCSPYDSALARRSCSHAIASVRAHGPRSKARSTIRASPTMPPWRANIPAWPLRSARITSKPLIVA